MCFHLTLNISLNCLICPITLLPNLIIFRIFTMSLSYIIFNLSATLATLDLFYYFVLLVSPVVVFSIVFHYNLSYALLYCLRSVQNFTLLIRRQFNLNLSRQFNLNSSFHIQSPFQFVHSISISAFTYNLNFTFHIVSSFL